MRTSKLDSKFDTETTSPTARQQMVQTKTDQNRSEKHFLADQVANARTAMMQIVQEMKRTLTKAADVRNCAKQHPWITTGSAAAAGFVAAAVLSRARPTSGSIFPAATQAAAAQESTGPEPAPVQSGFLLSTLGKALTGMVQTLLQSFIAAAVVGTEVDQAREDSRHGLKPQAESEPQMDADANGNP